MKLKLLLAVLLTVAGPLFAQCNYVPISAYHGYVCVASATVSNWNGCTGTLNVVIDNTTPYDPAPFATPFPVQVSGQLGLAAPGCPAGEFGGDICYTPAGSNTVQFNIGFSAAYVTAPTMLQSTVAVADDADPGITISEPALPGCNLPPCPGTGKCPCQPGGASSPSSPSSIVTCSEPINLASGNTYITEADVKRLPGTGPSLALERTWNSLWPSDELNNATGMFGPHWKSIYEERVYVASSGMMEYSAGDGSFTYFVLSGGVWTAAVPSSPTTVLTPGSSYWTLTFPSGETRFFNNTSGSLISIKDRNGNATQITYDSLGRMSTVTDSASRHLYFAYASNTSLLVSAVTSDVGLALSYTYDNQGRLVTVTNPDLSTENFQYNDPTHSYLITAVKDSQGKILESHTYDSAGRGLTGSRANGVEAVSIAYSN